MVDPSLSDLNEEQVRRVIRIALLCTQTSASLRPPMSRVVAMLSGDVEVSTQISTPGYLSSERKFDHLRGLMMMTDSSTFTRYCNSSACTSSVDGAGQSFVNPDQYPMFEDSMREGRWRLVSVGLVCICLSKMGCLHSPCKCYTVGDLPMELHV